jgi:transketolase
MRKAFIAELIKQARANKDIYLLVADVGFNLVEPFQREFPDRFVNVGIAEQSMIGIASGLAMKGKQVFCYSLGNFPTLRCLEQIRNDVCYHNLPVTIVNSGAGLYYGTLGSSHHATEDIAVMRAMPNMTVISPCDPSETQVLTKELCESYNKPAYLRLQSSNDFNFERDSRFYKDNIKIGEFAKIKEGHSGVCILATGSIVGEAVKAYYKHIGDESKCPTIISVNTIKPIDRDWLFGMQKSHDVILTVEEHNLSGGLGSAMLEALSDMGLNTQVIRIGLQDKFVKEVGSQEYLRKLNGLDAESIAKRIKEVLNA